jgi:CRP-like cAMP-binding protein
MSSLSHPSFRDRSLALPSAVDARLAADFQQRLARAPLRRVEPKEFVFAEADPISYFCGIDTGALALYKLLADGRRQVIEGDECDTRCQREQPRRPSTSSGTQSTSGQPQLDPAKGARHMSLGTILVIILIIFLLGGFSGRFGGYGYGYGHGGVGVLGTILIVVVILVLLGRI